ncbi:MAG: hypothetical protein ACLP4R_21030 [Solirubrobacteraceae bacterium]
MQHRIPDVSAVREPGLRARLTPLLLLAGLVVAGCGTSNSATTSAPHQAPKPAKVSASVRAQERALHAQVMAALHAPAPNGVKPGIPSFIPRDTIAVNRIVTATPSHPQLAIQGDSVLLDLASGRTLATMNGPLYNNKYVGTNDPTVPASFVLTFSKTHGTIPLAPDDFTILDQLGNNIVPTIRVQGGGPLPKQLDSGRHLTLVMSTIISAGDGSIVYNPTGITKSGHDPLVGWDFIVEDD